MITFNLLDDIFSHEPYSVAGRNSEYVLWDRNLSDRSIPTFYSHNRISQISNGLTKKENSYGYLFESRSIFDYSTCERYVNLFERVFTHNSEFIRKYPNCHWIPGGGIWVGGTYGLGEIKIHKKTNKCSLVSSNKQMCPLHTFRLNIIDMSERNGVDIYGVKKWVPIHETLDKYMFSIVVENFQDELYFTEKILNCFATGTIPIYLGAKNIGDVFNINGILQFNNVEELKEILGSINEDLYNQKIEAITDNFNRCLRYKSIEDFIYLTYFKS